LELGRFQLKVCGGGARFTKHVHGSFMRLNGLSS
jgi:hypothetical protein